jgi:hypothetical protein
VTGRLNRAVSLVNHRRNIFNRCFLSYSPFVTFPATLMTTTMGLGAWAWVPLVAIVVCAPWFVISTRSAPSPPTASMLSSSPLNKRSVLTRAVGSTSNCEVVTMVSPSPPRDATWTGLIGGDGVVTMMGGVRIYFSLPSPKPQTPPPPPTTTLSLTIFDFGQAVKLQSRRSGR